jgi:hypothetical protein
MADWKKLAASLLLEDGCIDSSETRLLKSEILDDGIVDEEEMQFLIGLRKSATSTCEVFETFFFESFKAYLLADGEIDAAETELIRSVLYADGKIDQYELEFLRDLQKSAKKVQPSFNKLCEECGA